MESNYCPFMQESKGYKGLRERCEWYKIFLKGPNNQDKIDYFRAYCSKDWKECNLAKLKERYEKCIGKSEKKILLT